jgi:hypothetical protein
MKMTPEPIRPSLASDDPWMRRFFDAMLSGDLSVERFEEAVGHRWACGSFIARAPDTAGWLRELALAPCSVDAGYAAESPGLGFRSQWLVGEHGQPGALHIEAPPERHAAGPLAVLNRRLHQHDSGRIAVITGGRAVFHVIAPWVRDTLLDCPVETGDVIFWPAWTPHTFNARDGFSLVSAMARYVSPAEDGFVFPVEEAVERLPRRPLDGGATG